MPGPIDVSGTFATILADPPWHFKNYSDYWAGQNRESRWAGRKYPLMSTEDIAALPVGDLAESDSCLFLWTTMPHLPDALQVMTAWGFTYKTVAFVWVKTRKDGQPAMGMGKWTRSNAELVLFGTRGHPKRQAADVRQVILAPRGKHSQKPEEAQDRIERLVDGPYLELFARRERPSWTVWGNEVES